ncbi:MAG: right-handed parallel beta-helix repeat-containing protein [Verrucomicrobiales bacterium]|nr:right-handed parallel beta-helix repeat-containing protein [Verrucomicrobiales bacterium]
MKLFSSQLTIAILALVVSTLPGSADEPEDAPKATDYPSIQAALDANPNREIFVPAGDYTVTEKIRLRSDRSGLFGPGRIIQENPEQPVIEIENGAGIEIRGLTLLRPEGKQVTDKEGVLALNCRDLVIESVKVINNRTQSGAITLRDTENSRISRCLVRNYMRISIDDRTGSDGYGFAFNCTDGTGISVRTSRGTLIENNTVIEENFLPTLEIKRQHKLGDFVKKNDVKGNIVNQQMWDAEYMDAWQQGSGIIVTSPKESDLTRILGNHIENAGQGIDLHCDHVIVANNVVVNSFIGMKAMHGSSNVLINGNQFVRNSLWAIGLMPGAAADDENRDGGSIVANNIISEFGYGDANWIWGDERSPIKFDTGQQPDDPPLSDVLIQGNLIHQAGEARYRYAVIIPGGPKSPTELHFSGNLFPPGKDGVSNVELPR